MNLLRISVVIPTKNAGKFLEQCLKSICRQDYPKTLIEVIIVDSYSVDNTVNIAKKYACKIVFSEFKLLGARYIGLVNSKGDYIVFLDADHIVRRRDLFKTIVKYMEEYDMLHLEEATYKPKTLIQLLISADKRIMQEISKKLSLLEGVLYARAFKRWLLENAYEAIPKRALRVVHNHDDIILHYETSKLSQKLTSIPSALWHIDESSFNAYIKKMMYYGKEDRVAKAFEQYREAIRMKELFRIREIPYLLSKPQDGAKVLVLLVIKLVAFELGKLLSKIRAKK